MNKNITQPLNRLKRAFLLFLLLALVVPGVSGRSRTRNEALRSARSFLQKEQPSVAARSLAEATSFTIAYTCTDSASSSDNALYYIVNTGNNNGFVIVSGDDRAKEILGYSDGGSFSQQHLPDNFRTWLGIYEQELKALALLPEGDPSVSAATTARVQTQTTATNAFATSIEPLIADIAWNQAEPYNILCPYSDSVQCITGCVATAMAQVMRYHQWPITGTGSKTYKPDRLDDSLTVDFSSTTYDWAHMFAAYDSTITAQEDTAVATLIYHCGVAVEMDYGVDLSGAYDYYVPGALSTYFGYDKNVQIYHHPYFTDAQWVDKLKTEFNASRPVLYRGSLANGFGHMFVCDGYDADDLFHFNWGWSGWCNGYFELSSMYPLTPGSTGTSGGFTVWQSVITGIQKPTDTSVKDYQMHLAYTPTVEKERIARESTFKLFFGYDNGGGNNFEGDIRLGLYKEDSLVSIIKEYKDVYIRYNVAFKNMTDSSLSIPSDVPDGTYQLCLTYKANDQDKWSLFTNMIGNPSWLDVTVSPTTIRITTPDYYPELQLTQPIVVTDSLLYNKNITLSATIQNQGETFSSFLHFRIHSLEGAPVDTFQYFGHDIYTIESGATRSVELTDWIILPPGNYLLDLWYDFNNNQAFPGMTLLTPTANTILPVTIYNLLSVEGEYTGMKPVITTHPYSGICTVQSESPVTLLQIFDLSGKQLLQVMPKTSGTIPVDITSLSKGFYLIRIETEEGTFTEKLFKK